MTELTDAQKRIAEVAHDHTHSIDFDYCYCGQSFFSGDGITGDGPRDWATHLAVEIDKALGGLRREVSKGTRMCSYPGSGGPCEGKDHGRWVSGWTPEIDEEGSVAHPQH